MEKKKVLICCPTADIKDYCLDNWLLNVSNFTYKNKNLYLCDNSLSLDYHNLLKDKLTKVESNFNYVGLDRVSPFNKTIKQAIALSHEKCRQYAINNKFDFILHLESDLFPPLNIIERLMDAKQKIIGGTYYIELGGESKLMIQQLEHFGTAHRSSYNLDNADLSFIDGTVKKVFSCGLGCVLIHKSIFKKYPFRYEEGAVVHPDSFFYGDLNQNGEKVYADTSIHVKHQNQALIRL